MANDKAGNGGNTGSILDNQGRNADHSHGILRTHINNGQPSDIDNQFCKFQYLSTSEVMTDSVCKY